MRQFYTKYPYSLLLKAIAQLFVTLVIANVGSGRISFGGSLLFVFALAPTSFLFIDLLILPALGIRAANVADWIWILLISLLFRSLGYLIVGFYQIIILVTGLVVVEHYFHKMLKNASQS